MPHGPADYPRLHHRPRTVPPALPRPLGRVLERSGQGVAGLPGSQGVVAAAWSGAGFVREPDSLLIKNDTLKQIYGYFYLYVDYYKMQDYPKLQESFLKASNLVENSNNPNWKAAICMRKAHLLELFDNDIPNAILKYIEAKNYCTIAKDSFCIAECLEQLSNLNATLGKYGDAHNYFNEAITLMKKFAGKAEMAMTYNNYSNLLSDEGNYNEEF